MFSQEYFDLALAIQHARSFDSLSMLLTEELPKVITGDGGLIFVTSDGHRVDEVYGESGFAKEGRKNLDRINKLFSCHPLVSKVDLSNPGELGFSVRDYVTKEEWKDSEFLKTVHGEHGMSDGLFGLLGHGYGRTSLLIVGRKEGAFSPEERGMFDSILLAARSVESLVAIEEVRHQVRSFFVKHSPQSRQALFVMQKNREVLPFNHDAVRLSETWWGQDEPFFSLSEDVVGTLEKDLRDCWTGPLSTEFRDVTIDLGGGASEFSCLPAWDNEVWMVLLLAEREAAADEALNALLTKRQREIMHWIAEGKTSSEAAVILEISPRTVEKHLEAIFRRFGVENRIAAVRNYLDIKGGQLV
ncbi:MAG: helix-turn-helix transcriptional regulator [Verrucomicrobiota bacterium]